MHQRAEHAKPKANQTPFGASCENIRTSLSKALSCQGNNAGDEKSIFRKWLDWIMALVFDIMPRTEENKDFYNWRELPFSAGRWSTLY